MTILKQTILSLSSILMLSCTNSQATKEKRDTVNSVDQNQPNKEHTQVKNYLTTSNSFDFNGKEYSLAWSSHPSDTYYKQEYITANEDVEKYHEMVILEVVVGDLSAKDALSAKVKELEARKASDSLVNYESIENKKTGEYMLDFVLSEGTITEWNVYRYQMQQLSTGKKCLVLTTFSKRVYEGAKPSTKEFLTALASDRKVLINAMSKTAIPKIEIQK